MSAIIHSVSLDQAAYAPGDLMTLTIDYTANRAITVTTVVTDAGGNASAPASTTALCGEIDVASSPARAWSMVSDDGSTAVFTAFA